MKDHGCSEEWEIKQGSIFVADEKYLRTSFIVDNFLNVARGAKDLGKIESPDYAFSTYMHI